MTSAPLRLIALDEEDLVVISANLQDAVFLSRDLTYRAPKGDGDNRLGQFEISANRLVSGSKGWFFKKSARRRATLIVKRVTTIRSVGVDRENDQEVHNLLAIQFEKNGEGPDGSLIFVLSGGAEIILDVETIELSLADVSESWQGGRTPHHPG